MPCTSSNKRVGDPVYHTTRWRRLRQAYYDSQYGICERCGQPGDIVHHKEHITDDNVDDPFVTFNADKLELLCRDCHGREHKKNNSAVRDGFGFDDEGNLIAL